MQPSSKVHWICMRIFVQKEDDLRHAFWSLSQALSQSIRANTQSAILQAKCAIGSRLCVVIRKALSKNLPVSISPTDRAVIVPKVYRAQNHHKAYSTLHIAVKHITTSPKIFTTKLYIILARFYLFDLWADTFYARMYICHQPMCFAFLRKLIIIQKEKELKCVDGSIYPSSSFEAILSTASAFNV